jgi:O-antigen/teichoic acid export membrane protein
MATRSKRFLTGLMAGYGSILVNVVFTLVSIPLALKYLDKERFGLWTLATQINGYLTLIDLGMSDAVSRFIADYKDDVNGGEYGVHLTTGSLVFLFQGIAILLLGFLLSLAAPALFSIPAHLRVEFQILLTAITAITGISVMLRGGGAPLWCFQRNDVIYGCSSFGFILNLFLLWGFLKFNMGLVSLVVAQVPTLLLTTLIYFLVCAKSGYYPKRGHWGRPSYEVFKRISIFGRDVLFVTLGTQLVNASPVMLISRFVGLQEAAIYSIATKFYSMAMQVVTLPITTASAGLTELYVRGELKTFRERYREVVIYILFLSVLSAVGIAMGNGIMISLWTKGAITWAGACNVVLGLLVIVKNVSGCHIGLFGIVKNWRAVRFVYFIEGLVLIVFALSGFIKYGLIGVLCAQLLANISVSVSISIFRSRLILDNVLDVWQKSMLGLLCVGLLGALAIIQNHFSNALWLRFVVMVACLIFVTYVLWRLVMTKKMREEICSRMSFSRLI